MSGTLLGLAAPWALCAGILLLHLVLPARQVEGYVQDGRTGKPLRYRLNGLLVLVVSLGLYAAAGFGGLLPWDWLWQHRFAGLAGACVLGVLFSLAIVLTAPSTGRSLPADLFLGRRWNPQALGGRVDAKMFLYLVGAVMLELNVLSFAAHHYLAFPDDSSPGVALYALLFSFFVCEYLFFERVHLYTYDLFAERVGFKLGWGCLVFYPWFYPVGLWATAERPDPGTPGWLLCGYALIFASGWALARGANMQKFAFKRDPERAFLGWIPPETLDDGRRTLLCNGFWGVSRHVNYLGEILMASGLTLVLGWPLAWVPWLYPLYYVLMLGARERDDDRRCAEKYGELWQSYRERVPWRIVPGVY